MQLSGKRHTRLEAPDPNTGGGVATASDRPPPDEPDVDDDGAEPGGTGAGAAGASGLVGDPGVGGDPLIELPDDAVGLADRAPMDVPYEEESEPAVMDANALIDTVGPVTA